MNALVAAPVLVPMLGAAMGIVVSGHPVLRRGVGLTTMLASLCVSVLLALRVIGHPDGILVLEVGGWGSPLGIVLAADRLSVLVLVTAMVVGVATQWWAVSEGAVERDWRALHPVMAMLLAGMALALLTADLFTLFVGFEVALVASYVLLVGPGGREQLRDGTAYIVANVVVSTLFLSAVAGIFAVTGTLSMSGLATVWPTLPTAVSTGLGLLLLAAFLTKAAVFPVFGWLPDAYRAADPAVAALFAGLLTKLGVYAILRLHTLLDLTGDTHDGVLVVVAAVSMLGGVLGALAQTDVRRVLSLHITSQIGYLLFGVALFTVAGIAGTVFYLVHHILVKTALFLVAGSIERRGGTGALARLGGMQRTAPVLAVAFAVPALSLAGIPPFSGFTAKLALLQAGTAVGAWWLVGVSLVASLCTVLSMAKLWSGVFWGEAPKQDHVERPVVGRAGIAGLVVTSLAVTVAAGPLLAISTDAAEDLLDGTTYIRAVDGGTVTR